LVEHVFLAADRMRCDADKATNLGMDDHEEPL